MKKIKLFRFVTALALTIALCVKLLPESTRDTETTRSSVPLTDASNSPTEERAQNKRDAAFSASLFPLFHGGRFTPKLLIDRGYFNLAFGILNSEKLCKDLNADKTVASRINNLIESASGRLQNLEINQARIISESVTEKGMITHLEMPSNAGFIETIKDELRKELAVFLTQDDSDLILDTLSRSSAFTVFNYPYKLVVEDIDGAITLRARGNKGGFNVVSSQDSLKFTLTEKLPGQGDRVMFSVQQSTDPYHFEKRWGALVPR